MYLNCHTGFSFKYGTLPIEGLFNEAKRCGVHKLVLTEIQHSILYGDAANMRQESRVQKWHYKIRKGTL